MAVAGFSQDELEITAQENTLQATGKAKTAEDENRYLHRGRLERLLQILEADLCGEPGRNRLMRDHYVARLVDIFDLIALAMRVSHA